MATLIQIRRDSQASWVSNDPVLALGEMAYSTDQQKLKVGNGSSLWSELSYINALPSEITSEINSAISTLVGGAPETLDTLNEIAAAINDDASFFTTVNSSISSAVNNLDTDDIEEGTSNLYFTNQRAIDAVAGGDFNTDVVEEGTINLYYTNSRVEGVIANSDTDNLSEGTTNLYFTSQRALDATNAAYDASGSASTAESNANTYVDNLIGDATVDGTGGNTVTDRISSAVAGIVDSAPGTLDTLNELAAALGDDANFSTTVTNAIGEKVAKAGDTMTGDLTLAQDPTSSLHAATKQYVDQAETDANTFTTNSIDALDTDDIEEGTTNLYYTNARVESVISTSDTDDLSEGTTNLYFTNQRAIDAVVENIAIADLSDVASTAPNDGELLMYSSSNSSWAPVAVIDGGTP